MMKIFDVIVEEPSKPAPVDTPSSNVGLYIGIIVGSVVLLVATALIIYFINRKKKQ